MSDENQSQESVQILLSACKSLVKSCDRQNKQIERLLRRPPLQRLYVTKAEAACLLGISTRKLDRWIDEGCVSTVRDSKAVMLSVRELESLPLVKRKGGLPQRELAMDLDGNEACHV